MNNSIPPLGTGKQTREKGNNKYFTLVIKSFLISISTLTMYPTSKQDRRAARLIYAMKYGLVHTEGQMKSWCRELVFLPPPLRTAVWKELEDNPGLHYYLKTVFHDVEQERMSILHHERETQDREAES
jgi:hypothetical protein